MKFSQVLAVLIAIGALIWIGSGVITGSTKDKTVSSDVVGSDVANDGAAQKPEGLAQVRVREVIAQPYIDKLSLTGRTQASRRVTLRAETAGQVEVIKKQEGEYVTQDEVLAQINVRDRKSRVEEASARVAQRRIEYNAAKKLTDKGFNSKVRLAQSLADLESAKAVLKAAELDLAHTRIKAPFDATIFEQDIEQGDFLKEGDALFTLVDLNPIEVAGFVSERHVPYLKLEQEVTAHILGGQKVQGQISYIAPAADPQTRTFRIEISAENAGDKIKDGLTARIVIPVQNQKAHQISPAILALNDAGEVGVKIVDENNTVRFVSISILADHADSMWVMGLPERANIITVGQDYVRDGQRVKAVPYHGEGLL